MGNDIPKLDWFISISFALDSVAGYPMTGLGAQLGGANGIGTNYPFRFLTYEGKSAREIKETLSFDIPELDLI